jgi:hypothetical protein
VDVAIATSESESEYTASSTVVTRWSCDLAARSSASANAVLRSGVTSTCDGSNVSGTSAAGADGSARPEASSSVACTELSDAARTTSSSPFGERSVVYANPTLWPETARTPAPRGSADDSESISPP